MWPQLTHEVSFTELDPCWLLDIIFVNFILAPDQTVVSGRETSVRALASYCRRRDIKTHMVDAAHGFHSRYKSQF